MAFTLASRHRLGDLPDCPKVARLGTLWDLGLAVPPGVVLQGPDFGSGPTKLASLVGALVSDGPTIVRLALPMEDTEEQSAAGLGLSVGGCCSMADVADAIARIQEHLRDPDLRRYLGTIDPAACQVLVQRQVAGPWLLVVAVDPTFGTYVEAHVAGSDALTAGSSPTFAGPIGHWGEPAAAGVSELAARCAQSLDGPHGLELELVVDHENVVWAVQARPLVAPLIKGWEAFAREANLSPPTTAHADESRGTAPGPGLEGSWVLDAEHNPAPLSPAHSWLMSQLRQRRPDAGHPLVLAGWLYVRTLPRALAGNTSGTMEPSEALRRLRDVHLPVARQQLEAFVRRARDRGVRGLQRSRDEALDLFFSMIDVYLGELAPARSAHDAAWMPSAVTLDTADPLTLRDRARFADVLPVAWDVASPPLRDFLSPLPQAAPFTAPLPDDPFAAMTLLREWDDHLFALGLQPVRQLYLLAAKWCQLPSDALFLLDGDELVGRLPVPDPASRRRLTELVETRRKTWREWSKLSPPLRIVDGRPVPPSPAAWLRGAPLGSSVEGLVHVRPSLDAWLTDPPPPGAILCTPTLTAQASLALSRCELAAVCTEHGGNLSHGALMARELGLTALIGCRGCTTLPSGTPVRVDTKLARLLRLR